MNVDTGLKTIKVEPFTEGESVDKPNVQLVQQKNDTDGIDFKLNMLPKLIIQSTYINNSVSIQGSQVRYSNNFKPNQTNLQAQQSQQAMFAVSQKINNRPVNHITNICVPNQMNINKQTIVNQVNTNNPVNQIHHISPNARPTDQNPTIERTAQLTPNQIQFTQNQQQIRGKFVSQNQQISQVLRNRYYQTVC